MRVETDEELIAADEELTSLAPLKKAMGSDQQLQHLNVSVSCCNVICGLSGCRAAVNLCDCEQFNRLTELNGLQHALALRNLNLMHNELTCIREVASLTKLRLLRCGYNQISDLRWLSALAELRELWVQHNQIEMPQLEHLRPLTQLRVLVLHPNPCTQDKWTYRARVVRMLPWLESLDAVMIDQSLRDQAAQEETDDRAVSAATDIAEEVLAMHTEPSVAEVVVAPPARSKKSKKQSAEDFFRDFPVQEYIPVESDSSQTTQHQANNNSNNDDPTVIAGSDLEASTTNEHRSPKDGNEVPELCPVTETDTTRENDNEEDEQAKESPPPQLSAIASAVLSLPVFGSDSILKKKAPSVPILRKKPAPAKLAPPATVSVESIQQQEWLLPYPNSSANAIQIRSDGSAIAKWPSGSVAVSIDREGDGFRIYAAHKDGPVALSFDSHGVGFLNYYPSGRTMLSTTSAGDGLYFSNDGYSIVRQWDAQRCIRDESFQPIDSLGEEADGSLLCKMNDSLVVRVQLQPSASDDDPSTGSGSNPLLVSVYFAPISDIRHVFVNAVNRSAEASAGVHNDACDSVFGGVKSLRAKAAKKEPAAVASHSEILSGIRAAVANL